MKFPQPPPGEALHPGPLLLCHKGSSEVGSPELAWGPHSRPGCRLFPCCRCRHESPKLTPGPRWLRDLQPSALYSKQEAGRREESSLLGSHRNSIQQFYLRLTGQKSVVRPHPSAREPGMVGLSPLQVQLVFCYPGRGRRRTWGRQLADPAPGRCPSHTHCTDLETGGSERLRSRPEVT